MTFPHVRQDGTFSVRLEFCSDRSADRHIINEWLASWLRANDPWERTWKGAGGEVVQVDRLHFADAFLASPRCVSATSSYVSIELIGRGSSAYWKDWMVRIIEGVVSDLGFNFIRAVDADSPLTDTQRYSEED